MLDFALYRQAQQVFCGVNIGFDGADGVFCHQFDTDGGGEVENDVDTVNGFAECHRVCDGGIADFEFFVIADAIEIFGASCGEVIEHDDGVTLLQQQFSQVTSDEA